MTEAANGTAAQIADCCAHSGAAAVGGRPVTADAPEYCRACGHPDRDGDPIVTVAIEPMPGWGRDATTTRIHLSHTTTPGNGFHGAQVLS